MSCKALTRLQLNFYSNSEDQFVIFTDCYCWRWRGGQVQSHPEVLSGHLHLQLQEDHRGGLPGEGLDGGQRPAGETDAVGHCGPGGV